MVFVKAHTLDKKIAEDAEQCAAKCWWEAHDEKNYTKAGDLFAEQEKIITTYAGNKPAKSRDIANCFALTLQKYDNFTEVLKTGGGELGDLEGQLSEMLFDVYKTLGANAEAARHNMEWWTSFARMRLAQKLMAKAQTDAEKISAKDQHSRYEAHMVRHMTAEHATRYGFENETAERLVKRLLLTEEPHNKHEWGAVEVGLKIYYVELLSELAKQKSK